MKKLLFLLTFSIAASVKAEVRLPGWMTSNMVLQQRTTLHLKAKANTGATVTATFGWTKKKYTAQAGADGSFRMDITVPKAGGPYTITFDDGQTTRLDNVMIGEVWFCSGQSNMEMPVKGWGRVKDYEKEVAEANHPLIRLFQVKQVTAFTPQADVPYGYTNGWAVCSPQTIEEFSATAYFFARTVSERLGVAVGVVNSSWGGTPAETWTSHEALKTVTGFEEAMERLEQTGYDPQKIQSNYEADNKAWKQLFREKDPGLADADIRKPVWAMPDFDDSKWPPMALPEYWEYRSEPTFDGVMWYRKEINLPDELAGKDLTIHFGAIDDEDVTYWNGELVAEGFGYNQPRAYQVPGHLVKAGRNVVAVRVTDTGGNGGIWGEPSSMNINGSISLAGDWKYKTSADFNEMPQMPASPSSSWYPSSCYNAMVAPFLDMPIQGFLWYQGCANVGRDVQYESLFQTLIHDWKDRFGNHPFYFVQLANYLERHQVQPHSPWAALRDAQTKALQIEGTGMMVNIDLGEAADIHPKNKQEVGRRLAMLALTRTYHCKEPGCAPEFSHMNIKNHEAHIFFKMPEGAECIQPNDNIHGFTIAGPDHRWYEASARTMGKGVDTYVVVSAPEVKNPVAVRYGWADNPECTLATPGAFHVSPFRTDNW